MSRDRRHKLHLSQPFARGASIVGLCIALGIVAFATLANPGFGLGDDAGAGNLAEEPHLFLARGQ